MRLMHIMDIRPGRAVSLAVILLVMALSGLPAIGQDRQIDSLFSVHVKEKGYTSVIYGRKMLEIMKDNSSCELRQLLDDINVIRIISSPTFVEQLREEAVEVAEHSCYELISMTRDDVRSAAFYFKQEPDGSSSFLMVSTDLEGTAVLDINGIFDVKDISRLSEIP